MVPIQTALTRHRKFLKVYAGKVQCQVQLQEVLDFQCPTPSFCWLDAEHFALLQQPMQLAMRSCGALARYALLAMSQLEPCMLC
jgi:hypothetical protein